MSPIYFDNFTLILYIVIAIMGGGCIELANSNKRIVEGGFSKQEFLFYGLFVFIFTFLAVVRQVSFNIGGTDAQRYIEILKMF